MAKYYRRFHAVAAPSRGEAWGMIPLEARACGVPIIATACTGHADHVLQPLLPELGDWPFDRVRLPPIHAHFPQSVRCYGPGVIEVHTGEFEPIDDGEGALGPSLRPQSVADALERAYHGWAGYAADARAHAGHLMERWSWPEVTKRWLESRRQA
jgi:glycosyltransferase involved in cell wall biosynthesis